MATTIFNNAYLSVGGNDISAYARNVALTYSADAQEVTAMGDDTHVNIGGLKTWQITAELNQDFSASALDSILFPLVGTTVAVEVRPDAGAVGTSNPKFTGNAVLTEYPPLGGAVGDVQSTSITLVAAGTLSRATA